MAALEQTEANRLLNASFGTATYTAPTTPMKLALLTVAATATAAGTEVTGGSYARQSIAMTSASSGACSNTALITFTNMPAGTIVGVNIYDSNATPRRAWFGALTSSFTTVAGDAVTFAVGAINASAA